MNDVNLGYVIGQLATALIYDERRKQHQLARSHERSSGNFAHLRRSLEQCVRDPRSLTGSDVGMIRSILNAIDTKRRGAARVPAARGSLEAIGSLAAPLDDGTAMRPYAASYEAFRNRRSLLLFNQRRRRRIR